MVAAITDGIKVSVETVYQESYSNPLRGEYMFGYRVSIENLSAIPMKLLHRQWEIFDSQGSYHEAEGAGVVGGTAYHLQRRNLPVRFWIHAAFGYGKMKGKYIFENLRTHQLHHKEIPTFDLVAPFKRN